MILIVDDRLENLLSLKGTLQQQGYTVHTAGSGPDALAHTLRHEYELIILDVQMPGMDGYEVAEALTGASRTRDIPILFLSAAHVEKSFITRGLKAGGVDYLPKPVDVDILLLKVASFIRLYRQHRDLQRMREQLEGEIRIRQVAEDALHRHNQQLEDEVAARTAQLTEANEALHRRNEELQQFAFVSSHDLKEPLRKLQLFTGMLGKELPPDALNERTEQHMERITAAARRMTTLINDLLNFSRIDVSIPYESVNLNRLLQELRDDMDLQLEEKKARLEVSPLPDIEAAPGLLRQVFQNLIANSLKFMKAGLTPHIRIGGERVSDKAFDAEAAPDGPWLRIVVQDNGIGFDEKYLSKIFVLFQRLHDTGSYEGTGIGLALVRKVVEKHGGIITATGTPGSGAEFILLLPVTQNGKSSS